MLYCDIYQILCLIITQSWIKNSTIESGGRSWLQLHDNIDKCETFRITSEIIATNWTALQRSIVMMMMVVLTIWWSGQYNRGALEEGHIMDALKLVQMFVLIE